MLHSAISMLNLSGHDKDLEMDILPSASSNKKDPKPSGADSTGVGSTDITARDTGINSGFDFGFDGFQIRPIPPPPQTPLSQDLLAQAQPQEPAGPESPEARLPDQPTIHYWNKRTYILCFWVVLVGSLIGWHVMGGMIGLFNYLELKRTTPEHIDEFTLVTVLFLTALPQACFWGSLLIPTNADHYPGGSGKGGRVRSVTKAYALLLLGAFVEHVSRVFVLKWSLVVLGLVITGFGVGWLSVAMPLYATEVAPARIRSMILSLFHPGMALGFLLACAAHTGVYKGEQVSPRYLGTIGVSMIMPIMFLCSAYLAKARIDTLESPPWEHSQDRGRNMTRHTNTTIPQASLTRRLQAIYGVSNSARAALSASHPEIQDQIDAIVTYQQHVDFQTPQRNPRFPRLAMYGVCFRRSRVWKGVLLQFFQQMTGANAVFFYSFLVLPNIVWKAKAYEASISLAAVYFSNTVLGMLFPFMMSRRTLLNLGSTLIFICLMVGAGFGHACSDHECRIKVSTSSLALLLPAFISFASIVFAGSWGPLPWIMCAEMFPLPQRATSMAITTSAHWLFGYLITFGTPFVTSRVGFGCLYIFGSVTGLSVLFAIFFAPRYDSFLLEEIDADLKYAESRTSLGSENDGE
ncbi:MFS general substrate transporter [Tothia fuscella]|uniref:MFS general substrate transporter n=1 Tax=Tothia fuscella TaxID=1048955 RepID=A0A9P4NGH1_9PEZI|nr:MFS general substrate transporter [Tothia fuscella]